MLYADAFNCDRIGVSRKVFDESKKGITKTITEPILEEYITVTRKNYISGNDGGKIVEKSFLELKGTFLIKICNNAFSGMNGEDAIKHIEKFLEFYPPSRTNKEMKADKDEVSWDQTDNEFENWLASKFENYMTMDRDTMYALWKYWKMESNKEVTNSNEHCCDKGEDSEEEKKIAEIFRIETDIFDYESPICKAFDEFNYLFQIDPDVLTKDIPGLKLMRITKMIGSTSETTSGHSKWPTCNWRDEEYCNGGNLPGQFQDGIIIHYQDYEWYEALEDSDLKDEALRNKVALEESMN
ncbi:hypothetical protein Tco_1185391 [Tanacetum coccineum]